MGPFEIAVVAGVGVAAAVVFFIIGYFLRKATAEKKIKSAEAESKRMVEEAKKDAEAAKKEIIRRYYAAMTRQRKDNGPKNEIDKLKLLIQTASIDLEGRAVSVAANAKAEATGKPATAIELPDGTIVTGKTSRLLGAASAALLNALKTLAQIDDSVDLISPEILEPITNLKVGLLGSKNPRLHPDELLIALSICAVHDPVAAKATNQLSRLRHCEMHSSVILAPSDEHTLKKLGINLTCEPIYETKKLYHG